MITGLATEFITHKEAKRYYKQGPSGYADIIPDMHRQRYTTDIPNAIISFLSPIRPFITVLMYVGGRKETGRMTLIR